MKDHGNGVISFDSFDEMQAIMSQNEDAANEGLRPEQIELRDDVDNTRYWVRAYEPAQCLIFGEAWSFKQFCDVSASFADDIPSEVDGNIPTTQDWADYDFSIYESVSEIRTVTDSRKRGYLRGTAYSVVTPNGEGGSTHVSNVFPISKEAFEEARASGWRAVDVTPFDLDLMGEDAARKGGWTPTLIRELQTIQKAANGD